MNKYKLYTDGSNKERRKIAGYGGYILNEKDEKIIVFSDIIHDVSLHTKHELVGLKKGLEIALDADIKDISCYTDYAPIVNVINTEQEMESLTELQKDIISLKEKFNTFEISYIPRNKNRGADRLSRIAIDRLIEEKGYFHDANKEYFKSEKVLTIDSFKDKKEFKSLMGEKKNYLVFNKIESDKLEVYQVERNNGKFYSTLLDTVSLIDNNQNGFLKVIKNTLENHLELKECVVFMLSSTKAGDYVMDMLSSYQNITQSVNKTVKELEDVLSNFDKIYIHRDKEVSAYLYNKINTKKTIPNFHSTPENIKNAIKELGEKDYKVGKNPIIEQSLKRKDGQEDIDFIKELQNHYLGRFLRIGLKNIKSENKKEKAKELMNELKEELEKKGISLKI